MHGFRQYKAEALFFFSNLIWDSDAWSGVYNNFPEGEVDMADLDLTKDSSLRIDVAADGNTLDGTISDNFLCSIQSPFRDKLIRGKISPFRNTAELTAYDFIDGHRIDFFDFTLRRDGIILTISHAPDKFNINGSRIARVPPPADKQGAAASEAGGSAEALLSSLYCPRFAAEMMKMLRSRKSRGGVK